MGLYWLNFYNKFHIIYRKFDVFYWMKLDWIIWFALVASITWAPKTNQLDRVGLSYVNFNLIEFPQIDLIGLTWVDLDWFIFLGLD